MNSIINEGLLENAKRMAEKCTPFSFKQSTDIYTGVFDTSEWVYKCYKNGEFLANFNIKSKTRCIKYLKEWISQ